MSDISIFHLHNAMRYNFYDHDPAKYIDIDEGWYKLALQCHIELLNADPDYRILQIKEKFGALRFYVEPSEEYYQTSMDKKDSIVDIIKKYEALSQITCEATGQSGVLMRSFGGWYKTLNPEWAAQNEFFSEYTIVERDK